MATLRHEEVGWWHTILIKSTVIKAVPIPARRQHNVINFARVMLRLTLL